MLSHSAGQNGEGSVEKVRPHQEYFKSSNPNPSYSLDTHSKQQKEACPKRDGA